MIIVGLETGMKTRRFNVDQILNKVHRGIVWGCIGLTGYGFYLAGLRVYRYQTVLKPLGEERKKQKELELLAEGQEKSEFLPEAPLATSEKQ